MAYGDDYTTALNNWNALSQNQRLATLGWNPRVDEGTDYGYTKGEDSTWAMGNNGADFLKQANQFNGQDYFNKLGIIPTDPYFGGENEGKLSLADQTAYQDNQARSFNQFGYNFGNNTDFLRQRTGAGHYETDPRIGQIWVPDNRDSNTWNDSAIGASGAPQGGFIDKAIGNFANSGGFVKLPMAAVLGAGAGDIFNDGANSFSNIFNQATGGGSGVGGGAGGGAGGGMSDTNFNWFDEVSGTNPDGSEFTSTNVPAATGQLGSLARSMAEAGLSAAQITKMLGDYGGGDSGGSGGSSGGLPSGSTSALAKLLGISDSTAQLIGAGGTTLAGILGANKQSDTLKSIFDQQRSDRAPALAAYNNTLGNPGTFYQTAPAMGAADAAARALSVKGNPAWNPGSSSQLAANNLGGYNQYLNNLSGPAFGGQSSQAQLGTAIAGTQGSQANAVAGGLGNITTPTNDISSLLKQLQGLSGTGALNFSGIA